MLNRNLAIFLTLFLAMVMIAGAVFLTCIFIRKEGSTTVYTVELVFNNSDGKVTRVEAIPGTLVKFPEAASFEGYSFLGWVDGSGALISADYITVTTSGSFSTLYTIALETEEHRAYIFPDEYGYYHPFDFFTKAEAAEMIASLAALPVEITGNFIDVSPDADYASAAAVLYQLQVIDDNRLHPDELITRGEYIALLAAFYRQSMNEYEFADCFPGDHNYTAYCTAAELGWIESGSDCTLEPDRYITQLEAAQLTNRVLGRGISPDANLNTFEGIFLELSVDEEGFSDMLEAVLGHTYYMQNDGELWLSWDEYEPEKTGFVLKDGSLYYILEDGTHVKNTSVDGFEFDSDGIYTSGNPELDQIIRKLIADNTTSDMDSIEKLHALYDYLVNHDFTYRFATFHNAGEDDWMADQALDMLTTNGGNCFSYTAVFYCMARALGFDSSVHVGTVGTNSDSHCWPTVMIDGTDYICDAEMEMAIREREYRSVDLFMLNAAEKYRYNYYEFEPGY